MPAHRVAKRYAAVCICLIGAALIVASCYLPNGLLLAGVPAFACGLLTALGD